jgi:nucleotide-binding universal stress UspA family protein
LHVVKPLITVYGDLNFTPLVETGAGIDQAAREEALTHLQALAQEVGIDPANVQVRLGYPADEISHTAKDDNVDLIVIGVHNRSGLSRLLGSTTRAVMNATSCPVLAIHPAPDNDEKDNEKNDSGKYNNILVAVDTSKTMSEVFAHASNFTGSDTHAHVISVVVPVAAAMAGMSPESFSSRWPLKDIEADILKKVHCAISSAMVEASLNEYDLEVRQGDPAEEVVDYATSLNADLIVIGSGRRNVLERLFLGSTTHAILNRTPCDVYVGR